MNWYIAKIVFKISNGNDHSKSQFDEDLRLIQANSFEEAILKARILGIREEDYFINDQQQPVRWEFVNVSELLPLNEIKDGLEVYSQIQEIEEASSYIHGVHQRAASLQLAHSPVF